jgi:hypothetical protein
MSYYLRLVVVLFIAALVMMWFFGDFNVYLGTGADREFKSFATPGMQLVGSVVAAAVFAPLATMVFALLEGFARTSRWSNRQLPEGHSVD